MIERDPMLRRFERNMAIATIAMAVVAAAFRRLDIAAGVLGGAALMALGYMTIKSAVNLMTKGSSRGSRSKKVWIVLKFAGRYALLGLGAYVMLVSLSMHAIGLLLGASAPFVAAVVEIASLGARQSR